MVKNQRNSCCHMGCPPMIGDLHFHRGYSIRLQESKPLKNNGIISCPSADHPMRRAPPESGKRSNVSASLRGGPPDTGTTKTSAVPAQVGGSSLAIYATQRPSGEYRGDPSAAPVR